MEQSGEFRIGSSREEVWRALNDPVVLAKCIDGCQSMEKLADDEFAAIVKAKIGPVSAVFKASLKLTDLNPPESYSLNADVKGGPAGFGKGVADVTLIEDGDATVLRYGVNASVGGKLAQIGSRFIDAAARKMADDFFSAFQGELDPASVETAVAVETDGAEQSETRSAEFAGQWKVWAVVFVALVIAFVLTI